METLKIQIFHVWNLPTKNWGRRWDHRRRYEAFLPLCIWMAFARAREPRPHLATMSVLPSNCVTNHHIGQISFSSVHFESVKHCCGTDFGPNQCAIQLCNKIEHCSTCHFWQPTYMMRLSASESDELNREWNTITIIPKMVKVELWHKVILEVWCEFRRTAKRFSDLQTLISWARVSEWVYLASARGDFYLRRWVWVGWTRTRASYVHSLID